MWDDVKVLAKNVKVKWAKLNNDPKLFSKVATEELYKTRWKGAFRYPEILHSLWQRKRLPLQADTAGSFGRPPVTVYDDNEFVIDIYFWVTPKISIHDHAFGGAFTLLHGLSLHCDYSFDIKKNLSNEVRIGDLAVSQASLLKVGDVREILPGAKFIHQVWHLARPTITLVIRTKKNITRQFHYLLPHLAMLYSYANSITDTKKIALMDMLYSSHSVLSEKYFKSYVNSFDKVEDVFLRL